MFAHGNAFIIFAIFANKVVFPSEISPVAINASAREK